MRIYAVADIHGKTERINLVKTVIKRSQPDILVIAGDITGFFSPVKTLEQIKDIPIPILGIRGNSDLKRVHGLFQHQKNLTVLNHEPTTCLTGQFLGLNGTVPLPFLSKIGFRETRRLRHLEGKITSETILVVHPPPRGVCDKVGNKFCAGSHGLRRFIVKHAPLMVLCGHIHEAAGYDFLNNSLVVNCAMNKKFSGAIIDCDTNMPLKVKMVSNNKR